MGVPLVASHPLDHLAPTQASMVLSKRSAAFIVPPSRRIFVEARNIPPQVRNLRPHLDDKMFCSKGSPSRRRLSFHNHQDLQCRTPLRQKAHSKTQPAPGLEKTKPNFNTRLQFLQLACYLIDVEHYCCYYCYHYGKPYDGDHQSLPEQRPLPIPSHALTPSQ
jgi:hypothetical protein